jgi:hypothetical protein
VLPVVIFSKPNHMVAMCNKVTVEWRRGSHTANVYDGRGEIDCFTFAWQKDKTQMLDFTTALHSYLVYSEAY